MPASPTTERQNGSHEDQQCHSKGKHCHQWREGRTREQQEFAARWLPPSFGRGGPARQLHRRIPLPRYAVSQLESHEHSIFAAAGCRPAITTSYGASLNHSCTCGVVCSPHGRARTEHLSPSSFRSTFFLSTCPPSAAPTSQS
eukprot:3763852-Rhodomonas_salina.3